MSSLALKGKRTAVLEKGAAVPEGGCLAKAAERAAAAAVGAAVGAMTEQLARVAEKQEVLSARLMELVSLIDRQGDDAAMLRRRVEAHEISVDDLIEDGRRKHDELATSVETLSGDCAILTEIVTSGTA